MVSHNQLQVMPKAMCYTSMGSMQMGPANVVGQDGGMRCQRELEICDGTLNTSRG